VNLGFFPFSVARKCWILVLRLAYKQQIIADVTVI